MNTKVVVWFEPDADKPLKENLGKAHVNEIAEAIAEACYPFPEQSEEKGLVVNDRFAGDRLLEQHEQGTKLRRSFPDKPTISAQELRDYLSGIGLELEAHLELAGRQRCLELAAMKKLTFEHWEELTGVGLGDGLYCCKLDGIYPEQYNENELLGLARTERIPLLEHANSAPLRFPCTPEQLVQFVANSVPHEFDLPRWFRDAVEADKTPPQQAEHLIAWYDNTLDASLWFGLASTTPREAAMLLCQFNPHDSQPDPLEVFNTETYPDDYKRLMRVFEDVANAESKPRPLMLWLAIAKDKGLKYHSWIDEYLAAMTDGMPSKNNLIAKQSSNSQTFGEGNIWKKEAMVAELVGVWPSIERDISESSRAASGLSGAHSRRGYWNVDMSIKWAVANGKIINNQATRSFVINKEDSPFAVILKTMFKL